MSTIAAINNGQSGLTVRNAINTNFSNLNTDKYQSGDSPSFAGLTLTGDLDFNSSKGINLSTPTSNNDAATKGYVDNLLNGVSWKNAADLAETLNNVTLSGEQTIDGVLTSNSRVLITTQFNATENGLYITGSGAWSRADDANTGSEIAGMAINILQGSTNADTMFVNTDASITIGTTNITFVNLGSSVAHNNTTGIQGGSSFEYYHLNSAQHTSVTSLTSAEYSQLANIDTTTISSTQWGYLGASNQGIATTDSVSFAQVTVDNLVANGNDISSTAGNLTLTPAAGSAVVIDGAATFDAGVVTGLTSLTVGGTALTGGTNTFDITNGTASLNVAAGSTVNIDASLTVESASLLNQDLTTDATPSFAGINASSLGAGVGSNAANHLEITTGYRALTLKNVAGTSADESCAFTLSNGTYNSGSYWDLTIGSSTLGNGLGLNDGQFYMYNGSLRLVLDKNGNLALGSAALGTTATDGFLYIPTCAGAPTGTPTAFSGRVPMIFDTTNDNFYIYNGSWKKTTTFA